MLSGRRLTSTLEIDPINRTARVSAGATLSGLNSALAEHGLFFPVDLGADPQIGGMVATNTGGTRLVRYGDVRRHVLGLEVVLGDGSVWRKMNGLRKDNTGLDWKQLFIGTSGSFGIVTKALLNVQPKPRQIGAVLAACESGEAVLHLLQHVEMYAGEFLSAFEVLSVLRCRLPCGTASTCAIRFGGIPGLCRAGRTQHDARRRTPGPAGVPDRDARAAYRGRPRSARHRRREPCNTSGTCGIR
ncbi:MAG: FAD-binding oxidoreductase [Planctomycetota bacterium]